MSVIDLKTEAPALFVLLGFAAVLLSYSIATAQPLNKRQRQALYRLLMSAETRAVKNSTTLVPIDPEKSLRPGDTVTLVKHTPLEPNPAPADLSRAVSEIIQIPPRHVIKAIKTKVVNTAPWYFVEVYAPTGAHFGKGWVSAASLTGQIVTDVDSRLKEQEKTRTRLEKTYKSTIAEDYKLSGAGIKKIIEEGMTKNWPTDQ